jgi:hypothetical protein
VYNIIDKVEDIERIKGIEKNVMTNSLVMLLQTYPKY